MYLILELWHIQFMDLDIMAHSALQYLVLIIYLCEVFNGILLGILPCDGLLPWLLADRLTSFLLLSSLLTSALEATVGGRDPLKFGVEV